MRTLNEKAENAFNIGSNDLNRNYNFKSDKREVIRRKREIWMNRVSGIEEQI